MAKPTRRVLALLEILQAERQVSGTVLAQRLGIDSRTLRRDITHLQVLGIPVEAQRGCDGGYSLRPGYKLPPLIFSQDEALAVALGLHAVSKMGLSDLAAAIASAQAKLDRVLPAKQRKRLGNVARTVSLEIADPFTTGSSALLMELSAACDAQQRVHLRYRDQSGAESARDFDPYALAYRGGAWYAVGHCHLRQALRSFRLDRCLKVAPLPASFGRPENFDVMAYLTSTIAALPRSHSVEVQLSAELEHAKRLVRPELAQLAVRQNIVTLRAEVDDLAWMARELCRLPIAFRIVKPAALRDAVSEHIAALTKSIA